jgi:hypothetical protein
MNEMSIAAHLCVLFKFKDNVWRGLHGTLGASDTIVDSSTICSLVKPKLELYSLLISAPRT